MSDRLILAIDTSFGPVSAAIATAAGGILADFEADNPAGTQAETLPPRVAALFAAAKLSFAQLARVAVTVGPGAFTGVRVGLAFAKGLRLATGAEVLGFTTLECLAAQAAQEAAAGAIVAAIDARRDEVYLQIFDRELTPLTEAQIVPVDTARDVVRRHAKGAVIAAGSGAHLLGPLTVVPVRRIDARLLARRAAVADPAHYPATAAYLRAPDARLPS